jgi:uncharacterized protein YjbI with pentapeptide repeats
MIVDFFRKLKIQRMLNSHSRWLPGAMHRHGVQLNFDNLDVRYIKAISSQSLQYASAVNADFSYVHFKNVTFCDADFREARFSFAHFENCDFAYSDFSGANFTGAKLTYNVCSNSNFQNALFEGTDLSHSLIENCDLTGADFFNANLTNARVKRCNYTTEFKHALSLRGMYYDKEKFGVLATNKGFLLGT